ncbi:MAG: hypothetical protein JXA67_17850 [Micromonosporaceae bacterium]|nr:hypothetical protein [Micromonosporaceae bacterium]
MLAGRGYRVHQNPAPQEVADARARTGETGDPASRPDYLVEGRVFDCYAPRPSTSVRSVWNGVAKKVRHQQTQRVVLNLHDWDDDPEALRQQFAAWPIPDLKEVLAVIPDHNITPIWHA